MIKYKIGNQTINISDEFSGVKTMLCFDWEPYGITPETAQQFLDSLIAHITYVREAGFKLGVPDDHLRYHDLSKFSLEEFPYYARNFFGDKANPDGFARAWLHHIHKNKHHWQHWIFPDSFTPKGSTVENGVVEMPYNYAKEMIADWMGASKAYIGSFDMMDWLHKNMPNIRVHSKTATYLRQELDMLGYADVVYLQKFAGEA